MIFMIKLSENKMTLHYTHTVHYSTPAVLKTYLSPVEIKNEVSFDWKLAWAMFWDIFLCCSLIVSKWTELQLFGAASSKLTKPWSSVKPNVEINSLKINAQQLSALGRKQLHYYRSYLFHKVDNLGRPGRTAV